MLTGCGGKHVRLEMAVVWVSIPTEIGATNGVEREQAPILAVKPTEDPNPFPSLKQPLLGTLSWKGIDKLR